MNRARELRDAFDGAFARANEAAAEDTVDLLAIRVAGMPYALRLAEVAGVFADRPITQVPARAHGLLGLAGLRNAVIPVFDLAALLDAAQASAPRWLVTVAGHSVALAFDALDGQQRVASASITTVARTGAAASKHAGEVARSDGALRPIISIASLIDALGHKES